MPAVRLTMRKTQEILRLKFGCGLSNLDIAKSISVGRSSIGDYLLRARAAGIEGKSADFSVRYRRDELLYVIFFIISRNDHGCQHRK